MPKRNNARFVLAGLMMSLTLSLHAGVAQIQTPEDKILAKAFAAYMDGNDKVARSYFEEVVRLNPHNDAAQKGLEKVNIRLKKVKSADAKKMHVLAQAKLKEGRGLLRTGDTIGAIDSFHAALDAQPEMKSAQNHLNAIKKDADRSVKKKNFNPSEWSFARGTMAYLEKDWSKAFRIWSERSRIEPSSVVLANATARAENNFKKMMVSEQEDFYRRSARAFYEQGYNEQSMNSWQKVLALRTDDIEALEGKARSEQAMLRASGKGRDSEIQGLLEEGLNYYASEKWSLALETFKKINELNPDFSTANEYIAKINEVLSTSGGGAVAVASNRGWRDAKPSNASASALELPAGTENFADRRKELESLQKRDPSNIKIQMELDRVVKQQTEEGERIYKDGLIAYSQGNRSSAIEKWKQVLLVDPEHKKAEAALRKARAEEERAEPAEQLQ